jgi:hypothetical protein
MNPYRAPKRCGGNTWRKFPEHCVPANRIQGKSMHPQNPQLLVAATAKSLRRPHAKAEGNKRGASAMWIGLETSFTSGSSITRSGFHTWTKGPASPPQHVLVVQHPPPTARETHRHLTLGPLHLIPRIALRLSFSCMPYSHWKRFSHTSPHAIQRFR